MHPNIRPLAEPDPPTIHAAFRAQDWNKPREQYERYWQEQAIGERDVLVAEVAGEFAGYLTIVWTSGYPPFRVAGIPEIVDFNVLKKFQRRGIGTALMDAAEERIGERSAVAGIGVGLYADYGPAQRLYAQRGYVPDGRGLMRNGLPVVPGSNPFVDDDLVLYFTKQLTTEAEA